MSHINDISQIPLPSLHPVKKEIEKWVIDYKQLVIKEEIGRGSYGVVCELMCSSSLRQVFRGSWRSGDVAGTGDESP